MTKVYYAGEARELRKIIRKNSFTSAKDENGANIRRYSAYCTEIFVAFYNDTISDDPRRDIILGKRPVQFALFTKMVKTGPTFRMAKRLDGSTNVFLNALFVHPSIPRSRSIQTMLMWYKEFFWVLNGTAPIASKANHEAMKEFLEKYVAVINEVYKDAKEFYIIENPNSTPVVETLDLGGVWTFYAPYYCNRQEASSLARLGSLHRSVR